MIVLSPTNHENLTFSPPPRWGRVWVAAGSGSAPEGLLPRRESLWLGEGRRFLGYFLFNPNDQSSKFQTKLFLSFGFGV
jgi:hypothetical protein